ncbi:TPA: GmrSD restriction endonuclease domain-containing protein [Streptococcus suis]
MEITVKDFKDRFIAVYGENVWKDFYQTHRTPYQVKVGFQSIEEIECHLETYLSNITNVKKFYSDNNKQFLRFILISIERAYRPESRKYNFSELYYGFGNEKKWEIEHIFSLSKFDDEFSNKRFRTHVKNSLGNLTLISRDLNGDATYKEALFKEKKEIIRGFEEKDFYINQVFRSNAISEKDYEKLLICRKEQLQNDFINIFKQNDIWNFSLFYNEVLQPFY